MHPRFQAFRDGFKGMDLDVYLEHCIKISQEIEQLEEQHARSEAGSALKDIVKWFPHREDSEDRIVKSLDLIEERFRSDSIRQEASKQ